MITIKQLSYHLSNNTLSSGEVEKLLQQFKTQEYERGIEDCMRKTNNQKQKRRSLLNQRLKEEFDVVISKLRDKLNK